MFRRGVHLSAIVAAILVGGAKLSAAGSSKPIHWRNGTVHVPAQGPENAQARVAERVRKEALASQPVSGLYVLQLGDGYPATWRDTLSELGVEVVQYVPEDAYVVRLKRVAPGAVENLPFVIWMDRYGRAQKLDSGLQADAAGLNPNEELAVAVLMVRQAVPAEVAEVRGHFRGLMQESPTRFGTILRGHLPAGRLEALARMEQVLWIEPMAQMRLFDEVASKIVAGDAGPGQTLMMSYLLDGSGVSVAVADTGLNNGDAASMHPDLLGRVDAFFYYGGLADGADPHGHGTHVAGIIAGSGAVGEKDESGALFGLGVAPGAHIIAQRIFDGEGGYEPPSSFELMTREATTAGADIGSNSWGDDNNGRYDLFAREFDGLVRDADDDQDGDQPYILEFSAGNAGPGVQTIGTPAVAKNVIATGASQNNRFDLFIYGDGQDAMADFSSRGPAEDGRYKPDVVAPGTWIASLQSASATEEFAWQGISEYYQYQGGTSQAGPHVSGAAAVFIQYYRLLFNGATPSPAMVKAALINSAVDMEDASGTGPAPNMDEGWGRVDLTELIGVERRSEFVDQTALLQSGAVHEHRFIVVDVTQPLKVTMTYTDVPGFSGAIPALVNDLDLELNAPDGHVYRGNQFDAGQSVPDATGRDTINNVEAVHLAAPLSGEYVVRIVARRVVEDARRDTEGIEDQDFALVMSGGLPDPNIALVAFDRKAYRAPDTVRVQVVDFDRAGQPSAMVTVSSAAEAGGEMISLPAVGTSGLFAGSIFTTTDPVSLDGRITVVHGDTLVASYFEPSSGQTRTRQVRVDLVPPTITGVESYEDLGKRLIEFGTDEPCQSEVYFGLESGSLSSSVTNKSLVTEHLVTLRRLLPGRTYEYIVVARDEAGNLTTNDNQGQRFEFVAPVPPAVLLVDAYFEDLFNVPPLSGYTAALDQSGYTYAVWDAEVDGYPTLIDMEPFSIVMWRVPEFGAAPDAASEQAIKSYLAGGGSFLMASMEVLSRLEEAQMQTFASDILHVSEFAPDLGAPQIVGAVADPVTAGINVALNYSVYGGDLFKEYFDIPDDVSDGITPDAEADPIVFDGVSGHIVGVKYPRVGVDGVGRVVFLSFALDAIPLSGPAPNNRGEILRGLLEFLTPPFGVGQLRLDRTEYTVPSLMTIELTDTDLAFSGGATVTISSDTAPAPRVLVLEETPNPGRFRGFVTLANVADALPEDLKVSHGDELRVDYEDVSQASVKTVTAGVETEAPILGPVGQDVGVVQARITWQTSEPADALVQFGESTFLGRTAYRSFLATDHELFLTGLQPNRIYYYRVSSRDNAGNVTFSDDDGSPYTLITGSAPVAPWSDDMEQENSDWFVLTDEAGDTSWEWGVPAPALGTAAHSPTRAWGSNLRGQVNGLAESFLISPPIFLPANSQITLEFWHWHEFGDLLNGEIEYGNLQVAPSTTEASEMLGEFNDSSGGWKKSVHNLDAYSGELIYLAWYHFLFTFDDYTHPGWLIDDISITVVTPDSGTIVITNNLAQAAWFLNGPLQRSGTGISFRIENAPIGDYTVSYGPVPYYTTPANQMATLVKDQTITVTGDYTFVDQNSNGMSDPWESFQFGEVSPDRTAQLDTDEDGATDGEEFAAGTDPNDPSSFLEVAVPAMMPDGSVRLTWVSALGRIYRVEGSADGEIWVPVSDWIEAGGANTSYMLAPAGTGDPFLFRVEAHP